MRAFQLVRAGLRSLEQAPAATAAAVLAAFAASLGLRAALRRAGLDAAAALTGRADLAAALAHAAGTLLCGLAATSLLVEVARAGALCAYSAPPGARWGRLGLRRAPAMISVAAVEGTVYLALAYGIVAVVARALDGQAPTARLAFALALAAAPTLALTATLWLAARVAIVLVARGLEAGPALVHGLDVALRRLPSLLRLGAALLVATAPLTLGGAALALAVPRLTTTLHLGYGLCLQLALLWSYAALGAFVGRDARLVTG